MCICENPETRQFQLNVLQDSANLARRFNRRRQLLIEQGAIPVDLGQRQNFFCALGNGAI
jgi:hypothetical protein